MAKVTAEVSRGLERHGWSKRRSKLSAQCGKFLMEMERFNGKAKAEDQRSCGFGPSDVAKAVERVSFLVVWAWATHFSFPRKILRVLGTLSTTGVCHSKDVRQSRSPPRPSCRGPSGAACFNVLCCRIR